MSDQKSPPARSKPGVPANPSQANPFESRSELMRMLIILVTAVSMVALTACSGSDDGSEQPHRGTAGPYISGGAGIGR
jgi:hypothetical protein